MSCWFVFSEHYPGVACVGMLTMSQVLNTMRREGITAMQWSPRPTSRTLWSSWKWSWRPTTRAGSRSSFAQLREGARRQHRSVWTSIPSPSWTERTNFQYLNERTSFFCRGRQDCPKDWRANDVCFSGLGPLQIHGATVKTGRQAWVAALKRLSGTAQMCGLSTRQGFFQPRTIHGQSWSGTQQQRMVSDLWWCAARCALQLKHTRLLGGPWIHGANTTASTTLQTAQLTSAPVQIPAGQAQVQICLNSSATSVVWDFPTRSNVPENAAARLMRARILPPWMQSWLTRGLWGEARWINWRRVFFLGYQRLVCHDDHWGRSQSHHD